MCLFYSGGSSRLRRSGGSLELNVNIRLWPYLAKQGLGYLLAASSNCDLDVGFVLEGIADEELPEIILGSVRLTKLRLQDCEFWPKERPNGQ